jgi:hypothetical protein
MRTLNDLILERWGQILEETGQLPVLLVATPGDGTLNLVQIPIADGVAHYPTAAQIQVMSERALEFLRSVPVSAG